MKLIRPVLLLIAFVTSPLVMASTDHGSLNGWYVGTALGHSDTSAVSSGRFSHKESTGSFDIYGGKNITDWVGFEFFYTRTNNLSDSSQNIDKAFFYAHGITSKFSYHISNKFSVFGKLGVALFLYNQQSPDIFANEETWTDLVMSYGVGAQLNLSNRTKLRLAYSQIDGDLDDDSIFFRERDVKASLDQLSLGVHYLF